jgi:hypothetical protein
MDKDTLFSLAVENGRGLMKPSIEQISDEKNDDEFGFSFDYVLTNSYHFSGASSLFYDCGLIEKISDKAVLVPVSSNEIYIITPVPVDDFEKFLENVEGIYQEFRQKTNYGLTSHALIYDKSAPEVLIDSEGNSFYLNLKNCENEENVMRTNTSMGSMTK